MTITAPIRTGNVELWFERKGRGPDVLLIAGLGDPVEAWQFQLDGLSDRYRVTAFDNRGMGRTPLPDGPLTVPIMADDAAALLHELEVDAAHVVGFSGGSVIAQELALQSPELVPRSRQHLGAAGRLLPFDDQLLAFDRGVGSQRTGVPRGFLRLDLHPARTCGRHRRAIVEEVLAFPHKPSTEAIQRTIDALLAHATADRLHDIAAPTLVLAGGIDISAPPRYGRVVAEGIPGACFEVLPEEAHQPFQEVPGEFNARVDAFWREVAELTGTSTTRLSCLRLPSRF